MACFRLQERCRSVQERSKRVQEASERLSRGLPDAFSVDVAFRTRFKTVWGPEKEALGRQKSRNFVRRPIDFVISAFCARVASGTRSWILLGSVLGVLWPSRPLKSLLEFFLERSRAAREHFFPALEASKSRPRRLQEASRLPRQLQELSNKLQDRFWSHFGAIWGAILELSGSHFERSLVTRT